MSLPKNASKAEVEGQAADRSGREPAMIEKIRQRFPPSEVVEYGRGLAGGDCPLHAHIFQPPGGVLKTGGAVLLFHGSGFAFQQAEVMYAKCSALAEQGVVAVSCTYSILPVDLCTDALRCPGRAGRARRRRTCRAYSYAATIRASLEAAFPSCCC